LPVPDDKKSVPKAVFGKLLKAALEPPPELLRLPFTSTRPESAECFVSLLLRPVVCPEVAGVTPEKSMEVRFFVPGGLVCNLDFVESIFGNAGDPNLPDNDAALDAEHWTGHTGCVILAPHLNRLTKAQLGLPDMRIPIQFALSYPDRLKSDFERFNFANYPQLTFEQPDKETFRNLKLAFDALATGGNAPCVLNAANEIAVAAFLNKQVGFLEMSDLIEETLTRSEFIARPQLEDYIETDRKAREFTENLLKSKN
jgi:hypothetical protein